MLLSTLIWTIIFSIFLGDSTAKEVIQPQPATSGQETEAVTLNCKYEISDRNYALFWYKQPPGGGLIFLIRQESYKSLNARKDRYSVNFQKADKFINLAISALQLGDSAMYFCALYGGAGTKLTFGKGTQLRVKPNIKDPQPALYQLTSPKSSDTSVCLLTDFDSSNTYTNGNDSTVLEMMTMESKSYGAVAWGSKSSFNCTNAFPQNIINLTQPSGSTCKVQDVEQSFETDKDLNLMNASLIFLRVIFLKTVGFNLLMTLRLWSN